MGLLDNLTLAYETLADDPIEVSIQYGKSILQVIGKSTNVHKSSHKPVESGLGSLSLSTRKVQRSSLAIERSRYANYVRRPIASTRRELVGAL